jgi:hypothetical protein
MHIIMLRVAFMRAKAAFLTHDRVRISAVSDIHKTTSTPDKKVRPASS